jgi:hypothetical protein
MLSLCVCLLCILHSCGCDIMSIGDNMYPHVSLLDPAVPVIWHHKFFAQRMAAAQAVRVNARGIRFISSQYSVLVVTDRWKKVGCISSTDSLCTIDTGTDEFHARLLPNYGQEVYSSIGNNDGIEESLKDILFSECTESATNRIISTKYKDISLCDVLGQVSTN